jgi:glycosyltransferase involved in cell wall biosynthesis
MKLLFIADGRSPIATNWISHFCDSGHEVHLISTYPCHTDLKLTSLRVVPVGSLSQIGNQPQPTSSKTANHDSSNLLRRIFPVNMRTAFRQWITPLGIPVAGQQVKQVIDQLKPDLVHAMRIPFEGMIASQATLIAARISDTNKVPILVSVWGNDFTLHANSTPSMRHYTKKTLTVASALHTDCQRDIRLAVEWGFNPQKHHVVLPGSGGVQLDIFHPASAARSQITPLDSDEIRIINPRGFRVYVQNESFFQAIPAVLDIYPKVRFICPNMANETRAQRWIEQLGIQANVDLLPKVPRETMADLFRSAKIAVSPTTHDGTPNTLLEAMACGCFPIAGDIESVREWIHSGDNGLLVDATNPALIAEAIINVLQNEGFQDTARVNNYNLVAERAEYYTVMGRAETFYHQLLSAAE